MLHLKLKMNLNGMKNNFYKIILERKISPNKNNKKFKNLSKKLKFKKKLVNNQINFLGLSIFLAKEY